jgi:hypothetical protein
MYILINFFIIIMVIRAESYIHVSKCCPENEVVSNEQRICQESHNNITIDLYNENYTIIDKKDSIYNQIKFVENKNFINNDKVFDLKQYVKFYISKNGTYMENTNYYPVYIKLDQTQYCIDYVGNSDILHIFIYADEITDYSELSIVICRFISCIFLVIVVIVYLSLRELRTLNNTIFVMYLFSLLFSLFNMALLDLLHKFNMDNKNTCIILNYTIYYSFISTFCWMNAMSINTLFMIISYPNAMNKCNNVEKFIIYVIYTQSISVILTSFMIVVNTIDMHNIPWFITPGIPKHGCGFNGITLSLYLYTPIAIILLINAALFIAIVCIVSKYKKNIVDLLIFYIKLSIITGLNWIFEIMSALFKSDAMIWQMIDIYNMIIGLTIFVVFICDTKIIAIICRRKNTEDDACIMSLL